MRILLAESDQNARLELNGLLSACGYEVFLAVDGDQAWQLLMPEEAPSLAIIDFDVDGISAVDLCRRVRQLITDRYVYVVMRTANSATPEMLASMRAGADDYIEKRCAFDELHARLRAGERILDLQQQLRIEATHDALTGALNRRAILKVLEKEASRAARNCSPLGVLLIDIDHFKTVNDTYGHRVGDFVLTATAERTSVPLRPYDVLGRYGGEEFLVVLPQCDLEQTAEIAERVRRSVKAPINFGAGECGITISVGAAALQGDVMSIDDLIQCADLALYEAKRHGRDRVSCRDTVTQGSHEEKPSRKSGSIVPGKGPGRDCCPSI